MIRAASSTSSSSKARQNLGRHRVAHRHRCRIAALSNRADGNVTIRNYAGQLSIVTDWQGPDIEFPHLFGGTLQCVAGFNGFHPRVNEIL